MAVEEYDKDKSDEPEIIVSDTAAKPPELSKDDVETEKTVIEEPFSQDDLPF